MNVIRRVLVVLSLALVAACSHSPVEPVGACESVPTMGSNGCA